MHDNITKEGQVKVCPRCGGEKTLDSFWISHNTKDGLYTYCKTCSARVSRRWRKENSKRHKENSKRWYETNSERHKAGSRRFRDKNPEYNKEVSFYYKLKRNKLSKKEYKVMLRQQDGVCAICGKANKDGRRLAIDHNHATGKVRGLLCTKCNLNLGIIESFLKQALEYLDKYD